MRQIIFICCLICVISCADKKAKTTTAAISPMEKVMEVHDALMPKMGTRFYKRPISQRIKRCK